MNMPPAQPAPPTGEHPAAAELDELPGLPLVLACAPSGAHRTAADHPRLPVTPAEIVREASACADAGATVLHLHVRDAEGRHSLEPAHYRAALDALHTAGLQRRLLLQITTEAVGIYKPDTQMAVVRALRPAAVSIAMQELVPDAASLPEALRFLAWARQQEVAVQFIVYDAAQAARLLALARHGDLPQGAPNVLFVLGRRSACQHAQPADLLPFLAAWNRDWPWSVCAFGAAEAQCTMAAAGLGGHLRVGFENNLLLPDGRTAGCNADLVASVRSLARRGGRASATLDQACALYGATRC